MVLSYIAIGLMIWLYVCKLITLSEVLLIFILIALIRIMFYIEAVIVEVYREGENDEN